jgi:hypothetical protein
VRIDPDNPKESTPDTENIIYYTNEELHERGEANLPSRFPPG